MNKIRLMRRILAITTCLLISYSLFAQNPMGGNRGENPQMTGRFYGKLVEAKSGKPVEYASVQLVQNKFDSVSRTRKEVVIGGMLTRTNGEFSLENVPVFGQFKLRVS